MRQIRSHAGLRGIAALLVVGYHLQLTAAPIFGADVTAFLRRSYLMVDLFFILSGFIICYVNAGDRGVSMPMREAQDFYLRRLIRLVPLHLFCLGALAAFTALLTLGYIVAGRPVSTAYWDDGPWRLVAQLLLLSAWLPDITAWNTPVWSISAELVAYLLFPLLLAARAHYPRLLAAGVLVGVLIYYGVVAVRTGSLDVIAGTAPLRCVAGFCLGCLIYWFRGQVAALPVALTSGLLACALIAIPVLLVIADNDVWLILPFAMLVACSWPDNKMATIILGNAPLLRLGDLSYSIYLIHVPMICVLETGWVRLAPRLPISQAGLQVIWFMLCYAVVIAASYWTYRHIKVRSRQQLSLRLRHRKAPPISAGAAAP